MDEDLLDLFHSGRQVEAKERLLNMLPGAAQVHSGDTSMRIVAVGLNHQAATLPLRDQVAIGPGEMGEALEALRDRVGIGVILSTCNRSEVYTLASSVSQGEEQLKGFFTAYHQVPRREIEPHLYTYSQRKRYGTCFG